MKHFFKLSVTGGGETSNSHPAAAGQWAGSPQWLASPTIPTNSTPPMVTRLGHHGDDPPPPGSASSCPRMSRPPQTPRAPPFPTLPGAQGPTLRAAFPASGRGLSSPPLGNQGGSKRLWRGGMCSLRSYASRSLASREDGRAPTSISIRDVQIGRVCTQCPPSAAAGFYPWSAADKRVRKMLMLEETPHRVIMKSFT